MEAKTIIDTLLQIEEKQPLNISVQVLNLSNRVRHSLLRERIATIGRLINQWNMILGIQNLGHKGRIEVLEKLNAWYLEAKKSSPPDGAHIQLDLAVDEKVSSENQAIDWPFLEDVEKFSKIPIEALDISIRAYNSLKRRNIDTVDQVYQQWDKICSFKNVGPATRAEIRTALASFQDSKGFWQIQNEVSPSKDSFVSTNARNKSLVTDSVERLKLSHYVCSLLKKNGVHTINQITPTKLRELKSQRIIALPTVIEIQQAVWNWLSEDEKLEGVNLEIQELDENQPNLNQAAIEETDTIMPLDEDNFEEYFYNFLQLLSPRYISIIEFRFGLKTGEPVTLQVAAEHFGLTRSRLQQIEFLALQKLRIELRDLSRSRLVAAIKESIDKRGGFISESRLLDELKSTLRFNTYSIEGIILLLKKLFGEEIRVGNSSVKPLYIEEFYGWTTNYWNTEQIIEVGRKILDILSITHFPLQWANLYPQLLQQRGLIALEESLAHAIALAMNDNHQICRQMDGSWSKNQKSTRYSRIISVMREIGQAAHFSEIAERYNQIFSDQPLTENSIHGVLHDREEFVRIGRGKYGLREWGLQDDGNVANAVRRILISHNHPMDLSDVMDEVLKTWDVSKGSILAAIEMDARFSKTGDGKLWLTASGLHIEKRIKRDDESRVERVYSILKGFGQPQNIQHVVESHNKAHPERPLTVVSAKQLMYRKKELFKYLGSETFALAEWGLEAAEEPSRDRKKEIIDIINEHGPIHINDLYVLYNQTNANSPISRNTLNMYLSSLKHLLSRPQRGVYELRALKYEIG